MVRELKVGSLFAGIGGIELGFERAGGFKTLWFVENEPYAQAVLRKHWPDAEIYGDITGVDFKKLPRVDVLVGGFPCQDISTAGRRAGIKGSRSSLWKHFARAIREIQPRYAVVENVAALAHRGLDTVLGDLAQMRYDAEWAVLSAASVGAPHRRERIFIIAYRHEGLGERPRKAVRARRNAIDDESRLADADGARLQGRHGEELRERAGERSARKGSAYVPDAEGVGDALLERRSGILQEACASQYDEHRGWWETEPGLGRVVNGLPNWAHRIKSLGNAVVPRCAQVIAEAIKEEEGA